MIKLEAGELSALRFGDVDSCLSALGARLLVSAAYRGAEADRLLDGVHAALVSAVVRVLRNLGWETRVEVSFSDYGDRGSIDVLAWHARLGLLLVIEVKSELGSIEGTLRPLDIKARLARKIARERYGLNARGVSLILVLPENTMARRAVARNKPALDSALPARSRQLRAWLREPAQPVAGIWFLSAVPKSDATRNPSSIQRIRPRRPRSDRDR